MKTKQTNKQYRGWVLAALLTLAMFALMAIPQEGLPMAKWFALLFGSKVLFLALFALACRLYNRWSARGGFGEFFDRLMNEED